MTVWEIVILMTIGSLLFVINSALIVSAYYGAKSHYLQVKSKIENESLSRIAKRDV